MFLKTIPVSRIALLAALITVALIPVFTWNHLNFCNEEGSLRMVLNSVSDEHVSIEIVGAGARRHRSQRDKIILYTKSDRWYLAPYDQGDVQLRNDCSWYATGLHDGNRFAAFLVKQAFQPPSSIPASTEIYEPPFVVDGENIIAWIPWGDWPSEQTTNWLSRQMVPNDIVPNPLPDRRGLIISYRIPNSDEAYPFLFSRSWIYDDALAAIGFTTTDDQQQALRILSAIGGHIDHNGQIGFSHNTENEWYDTENHLTAAIAWIGYTFVFYQSETGDAQYQAAPELIAHYLLSLQNSNPASPSYGSISNGPDMSWYTTADNIIAYFFLRDLGKLTGSDSYTAAATLIKDSLLNRHWNEVQGRFDQTIGESEIGLVETHSLGALFLIANGEIAKAQLTMEFVEETYSATVGGTSGYAPYRDRSTVWTQPTLQMALAYRRIGNVEKSSAIMQDIISLQDSDGGIPYAMPQATVISEEVFHDWPSVAGTAWLTIVLADNDRFLGQ